MANLISVGETWRCACGETLRVETFAEVVKRAHEAGLPYPDLVAAFHRAQGGE